MSKDKLVIEADRHGYRIQWYIASMEDLGAVLGESPVITRVTSLPDSEDWEHEVASVAVIGTNGIERDSTGYYWESRTNALAALKIANAALKNRPLADWEQKALAAGWKPPKGRL